MFCNIKIILYLCNVIKERLQRICLMPKKEELTPTNPNHVDLRN